MPNEKHRILIVDDTSALADSISDGLSDEGYETVAEYSGAAALRRFDEHWNLVILDLMLPDMSGETLLDNLALKADCPSVLILTAKTGVEDKVSLFRRGCDDYLTKPFAFDELLGRVAALLRRAPRLVVGDCSYEDMLLDMSTHRLNAGGNTIALTPKESGLLKSLMRKPGRVVSRRELLHTVWGVIGESQTNLVQVHLANLRKKLSSIGREDWLQTVRTSGVVLCRPDSVEYGR